MEINKEWWTINKTVRVTNGLSDYPTVEVYAFAVRYDCSLLPGICKEALVYLYCYSSSKTNAELGFFLENSIT